jgi:Enoyl-CoA hydratase/isomerase
MERTEQQSLPVLLREDRGAVSILTLNRPEKLNALSNELISAIMKALDRIELDHAIRAIIVTGTGRAFSSGADIAAFQRHMEAGPAEAVAHFMRPGHQMTRRVESFPKPIIAAVNGLAFGGGCELVEATHIAHWPPRWRPFIAAWMRRSTTAWRSRRLHLRASSPPMTLGKVWRHSWRNVARHSSADNAV